jgi:MarR family transcriptional regulator, 2-MHQ and catechol-resistance regulon repressor
MTKEAENRENFAVVLALLRSAQQFHRAIGPVFRATGLTSAQWDILETLSNKGPQSVNDLLGLALSSSGNLDVVVKNLVKSGLVEKTIDEKDRRSRIVSLTEAGKMKVEDFSPTHNQALARIFGNLTPSEKRQTIKSLNQFRRKIHLTQTQPQGGNVL